MKDISARYLFIPAIGDDNDDEELFAVLPAEAFSIRVGIVRSDARFNRRAQKEVIVRLEALMTAEPLPRAGRTTRANRQFPFC